MKVAIVSAASSIHTVRWVNGLAQRGLNIHLISAHDPAHDLDHRVCWHRLHWDPPLAYVTSARELTAILREVAPDLVNVHYASGYGLLARLSGFQPTLLSVWGMDVYDFPQTSFLHRYLLGGNLAAATAIASTSHCMARRVTALYPQARVFITPFGVDEQLFVPGRADRPDGAIVIGTVKTLARKYGIDTLIEAFSLAAKRLATDTKILLEITGAGPDEGVLRQQVQRLGIESMVTFHGSVPYAKVPQMLQRLDVFAALSRDDSESFGVAAIEAAACEKAIVVSDAEGLAEVTQHMQTGWVVPKDDAGAAADALVALIRDGALRQSLGRAARVHVLKHYSWTRSLDLMVEAYEAVVRQHTVRGVHQP